MHVELLQGNRHDSVAALNLLEYARGENFIADAAYDSNKLLDEVRAVGMKPVICPNKTRKKGRIELDQAKYATRYIVEVFFHHLKRFRAIATRYEKTARNYLALVHLACFIIRLPPN